MDCNLESSYHVWLNSWAFTKYMLNKWLLKEQMHDWINDSMNEYMRRGRKASCISWNPLVISSRHLLQLTYTERKFIGRWNGVYRIGGKSENQAGKAGIGHSIGPQNGMWWTGLPSRGLQFFVFGVFSLSSSSRKHSLAWARASHMLTSCLARSLCLWLYPVVKKNFPSKNRFH